MECREISRIGRRQTVGALLALGFALGACSAGPTDDSALAFNDEVTVSGGENIGRSVGVGTDPLHTTGDEAEDDLEDLADVAQSTGAEPAVAQPEAAEGGVSVAEAAADQTEGDEPIDEEQVAAEPEEGEAPEVGPVDGQDSELVGTTGVTARELMRNLAAELGGTPEILADPERTNDGGTFAFELTSDTGVRRVDVTFAYIASPDIADLIVGHEAIGVVVNQA